MKKVALLLILTFAFACSYANDDKEITFSQLPKTAQAFVKQNFDTTKISYVTKESELFDTDYNLFFEDGTKIEFNKKGNWTSIKNKASQVCDKVIPKEIFNYIAKK